MKQNKSRRSVANTLVNKFINTPFVGITHIKVSEAGNFEIKATPYKITGVNVKLRVNLSTLTYVFEFYGQHGHTFVRDVMTKRRPINTSFIPDNHNFFYMQLENELRVMGIYKGERTHTEMYMGTWLPPSIPPAGAFEDWLEQSKKTKPDYLIDDANEKPHVRYAKMSGMELELHKMTLEQQYEQLQRERAATPLFSDEQMDALFDINTSNKFTTLPMELNASFPDLDIVEERTTKGDINYFVTASKLTNEQVANLLNVVENPPTKLRQIMDNISADGRVTISIDTDNGSVEINYPKGTD